MKVVVGLGNPGPKYAGTRHNVGFEVIDYLAAAPACSPFREKFEAFVAEWKDGEETVLLVKPLTCMNRFNGGADPQKEKPKKKPKDESGTAKQDDAPPKPA